jgi:hypothetical protein
MRNMMLLSLIVLSLALNCTATAPMQLGGDSGKTALAQVASLDATNQTTNASQGDLWTWGKKIPVNYALDESGELFELPWIEEDNVWLGAISSYVPLNSSVYN